MNRRDLASDLWHACDIMRRDDGTSGLLQYMEQLSWLIFLKIFEAIEERVKAEAEFAGRVSNQIIDKRYQWSSWAEKDWRAEELVKFIDDELIPYLTSLSGSPERDMISTIFRESSGNLMKSGFNLKDVISIVDEIDFNSADDSHVVSQLYEELLLKMGKEGGVAGEFYTPRDSRPILRLVRIPGRIVQTHRNIKATDRPGVRKTSARILPWTREEIASLFDWSDELRPTWNVDTSGCSQEHS